MQKALMNVGGRDSRGNHGKSRRIATAQIRTKEKLRKTNMFTSNQSRKNEQRRTIDLSVREFMKKRELEAQRPRGPRNCSAHFNNIAILEDNRGVLGERRAVADAVIDGDASGEGDALLALLELLVGGVGALGQEFITHLANLNDILASLDLLEKLEHRIYSKISACTWNGWGDRGHGRPGS